MTLFLALLASAGALAGGEPEGGRSPPLGRDDCTSPASSNDLMLALENAEGAYSRADGAAFQEATARSDSLLGCLREPLTRGLAARYHRVRGLVLFLARQEAAEQASFAASRAIQPLYQWPADLVPVDHPIRDHWLAIGVDAPASIEVPEPAAGTLWFDGRESRARPTSWPAVLQHVSDDGAVVGTWYLVATDTLPDYPRKAPPPVAIASAPSIVPPAPVPPCARTRRVLAGGAAGSLLSAGALYAGSLVANRAYYDGTDDAAGQRDLTNGLAISSFAVGGIGLVAGAGAAVACIGQ